MTLAIHSLSPKRGARQKSFRVGRGHGSGRGKTSGRGTKGQRSRTGGKKRLKLKGMKQMLLQYPKLRGFQSRYAKATTVSVGSLERFDAGATVDLAALKRAGIVERSALGAKIVAGGTLTKKLSIRGIKASATARQLVEKAGGKML